MKLRCAVIRKLGDEWGVTVLGMGGPWYFKDWWRAVLFADRMTRKAVNP